MPAIRTFADTNSASFLFSCFALTERFSCDCVNCACRTLVCGSCPARQRRFHRARTVWWWHVCQHVCTHTHARTCTPNTRLPVAHGIGRQSVAKLNGKARHSAQHNTTNDPTRARALSFSLSRSLLRLNMRNHPSARTRKAVANCVCTFTRKLTAGSGGGGGRPCFTYKAYVT